MENFDNLRHLRIFGGGWGAVGENVFDAAKIFRPKPDSIRVFGVLYPLGSFKKIQDPLQTYNTKIWQMKVSCFYQRTTTDLPFDLVLLKEN